MSRRLSVPRAVEGAIVLAAVTVAGLLVHRELRQPEPQAAPESGQDLAGLPAPSTQSKREVVVTFIGDADCGACASEGFRRTLASFLEGFREAVEENGDFFHTVGVAVTPDLDRGYRYLEGISAWDEISLGSGVLNTHVGRLIWDLGSEAEIPQVVVYSHTIHNHSGAFVHSDVTRPRIVRGVTPLREIAARKRWDLLLRE